MAVSVTQLQTYIAAAETAIDDGDNATARKKIALAKVVLAGLPTRTTTSDGTSVDYSKAIDALESVLKDQASIQSGGYVALPAEFRH